jgi:hypothetical protein
MLAKGLRNHTKLFNSRQRFGIILSPLQAVNLVIVIVENKILKLSLGCDMNWEMSIATLQLFKFPQNISENNFLISLGKVDLFCLFFAFPSIHALTKLFITFDGLNRFFRMIACFKGNDISVHPALLKI